MRIGIDARLWDQSGVGRYIRNLIEQLCILDQTNTYVLFFRRETFDHVTFPAGNVEKKLADIPWHSITEQIYLPKALYKAQLDLVHFPYFSVPIFYHKPYVVTIHDLIIDHFPTGKASTLPAPLYHAKRLGYQWIMQTSARHAAHIITVSQATKAEVIDHLHVDPKKITVTYEGVDSAIVGKKTELPDRLHDTQFFLYVGNAYPHKNLDRLIASFHVMQKKHGKAKLVLVGKQDYFYQKMYEKVTNSPQKESILFLGQVSDEQLAVLYHHAIALVLPSLMEGFGLPVLEAMQNGCLVVASDIAAHREIADHIAIFADPQHVLTIASALSDAIEMSSAERKERIAKGIKRAEQFSWKTLAKETHTVYMNAV